MDTVIVDTKTRLKLHYYPSPNDSYRPPAEAGERDEKQSWKRDHPPIIHAPPPTCYHRIGNANNRELPCFDPHVVSDSVKECATVKRVF